MAESGIYEIVNLANGKRYVGSAVSISRRWREHRRDLEAGCHHSIALQRAWLRYGEHKFEFRVIEVCAAEMLISREQAAFDGLRPEYNICKIAGSSFGIRHTDKARKKMSEVQRLRWEDQPIEARQAQASHLSDPEMQKRAALARIGVKYRPRSEDHCRKISAAKAGKPNPKLVGREVSEETRQKLRDANLGKRHTINARLARCTLTEETVLKVLTDRLAGRSYAAIAETLGIKAQLVGRICRRERYEWVAPELVMPDLPKKGRKIAGHSEESKERHSAAGRARWAARKANGVPNPKHSKPRTEAQRARISEAAKRAWQRKKAVSL